MSMMPYEGTWKSGLSAKGSYSALSCYYLTFVDEKFAKEQYTKLQENFYQKRPIAGFKEYYDRKCILGFDIDAGPIIFNLSPTGTAFGLGYIILCQTIYSNRQYIYYFVPQHTF